MQTCRLEDGGRIDRSKPIGFSFNGKAYQGYVGDTLASALLANGVHLVGRSFKYHRPRGIVGCGASVSDFAGPSGSGGLPYSCSGSPRFRRIRFLMKFLVMVPSWSQGRSW